MLYSVQIRTSTYIVGVYWHIECTGRAVFWEALARNHVLSVVPGSWPGNLARSITSSVVCGSSVILSDNLFYQTLLKIVKQKEQMQGLLTGHPESSKYKQINLGEVRCI